MKSDLTSVPAGFYRACYEHYDAGYGAGPAVFERLPYQARMPWTEAFNSPLGEMLEKGQDTRNPRMHVITGPGRGGHNPDDDQDSHDPAC
jgi:hypothetical protein